MLPLFPLYLNSIWPRTRPFRENLSLENFTAYHHNQRGVTSKSITGFLCFPRFTHMSRFSFTEHYAFLAIIKKWARKLKKMVPREEPCRDNGRPSGLCVAPRFFQWFHEKFNESSAGRYIYTVRFFFSFNVECFLVWNFWHPSPCALLRPLDRKLRFWIERALNGKQQADTRLLRALLSQVSVTRNSIILTASLLPFILLFYVAFVSSACRKRCPLKAVQQKQSAIKELPYFPDLTRKKRSRFIKKQTNRLFIIQRTIGVNTRIVRDTDQA